MFHKNNLFSRPLSISKIRVSANRKLKEKFKSHIGRTFILRKNDLVSTYSVENGFPKKYVKRQEEFGEAVFVLDETNTRVCVTNLLGMAVWIPKFYLHKELSAESTLYARLDHLCEAIGVVMEVSRNLRIDGVNLQESATQLEKVAASLRQFADEEQTSIKGT